jgi:hypothetical protein
MFKPSSIIQLVSFITLLGVITSFVLIVINYKNKDFPTDNSFNTICSDVTLSKINLNFPNFIKVSLVLYSIICISQLIIYRIKISTCVIFSINIFASILTFMIFSSAVYFVHQFKNNSDCFHEYREYRLVMIDSFIALCISYMIDIFILVLVGLSTLCCSYSNEYEPIKNSYNY